MSATVSIRIGPVRSGDYGGQRTLDMRTFGKPLDYVDYEKTHLNTGDNIPTIEAAHRMNEDQKEAARIAADELVCAALLIDDEAEKEAARAAVMACRQDYKRDGVVAYRGVLTYGREAQDLLDGISPDEQDKLARESIAKAAAVLENVSFGVTAHRDESALHYHYYMLATNERGVKIKPKKTDCSAMQTAAAIPYQYLGINRGKKNCDWIIEGNEEKTVHISVQEFHKKLSLEIAEKERKIIDLREQIEEQEQTLQAVIEKHLKQIRYFKNHTTMFKMQRSLLYEQKCSLDEQRKLFEEEKETTYENKAL